MSNAGLSANTGTILSVRGSVVDVRFEQRLPPINTLLRVGKIAIEVWAQLDAHSIRGIALTPTQGLPYVFSKAQYADGNVFFAPTPESQVGASVQVERQTFGDGVYGVNVRGELAVYYFF